MEELIALFRAHGADARQIACLRHALGHFVAIWNIVDWVLWWAPFSWSQRLLFSWCSLVSEVDVNRFTEVLAWLKVGRRFRLVEHKRAEISELVWCFKAHRWNLRAELCRGWLCIVFRMLDYAEGRLNIGLAIILLVCRSCLISDSINCHLEVSCHLFSFGWF
jgi:hypothetical protein